MFTRSAPTGLVPPSGKSTYQPRPEKKFTALVAVAAPVAEVPEERRVAVPSGLLIKNCCTIFGIVGEVEVRGFTKVVVALSSLIAYRVCFWVVLRSPFSRYFPVPTKITCLTTTLPSTGVVVMGCELAAGGLPQVEDVSEHKEANFRTAPVPIAAEAVLLMSKRQRFPSKSPP